MIEMQIITDTIQFLCVLVVLIKINSNIEKLIKKL